ncbi:hypothetical protein KL86PLE_40243 [uncultured Pleomorphomonas sp.]|uniref:Uncharacterized protein n=1 Tax=uncultured Pleomorphomonas sp. TaxID=442121 RepID=A0A212LG17_9HYPH|nr:hypothetical protein KL86PLE_40243 [uncultured Pleomorphomonas sp.]
MSHACLRLEMGIFCVKLFIVGFFVQLWFRVWMMVPLTILVGVCAYFEAIANGNSGLTIAIQIAVSVIVFELAYVFWAGLTRLCSWLPSSHLRSPNRGWRSIFGRSGSISTIDKMR